MINPLESVINHDLIKKTGAVLCFLSPQFNFVTQLYLFALFVKARTRVLETETVMIS